MLELCFKLGLLQERITQLAVDAHVTMKALGADEAEGVICQVHDIHTN